MVLSDFFLYSPTKSGAGRGCKWGGQIVHIAIMCDYSNIVLINLILTLERLLTLDSETEIDSLFLLTIFFHYLWFDWLGLNAYLEGATPPPLSCLPLRTMWLMSPQGVEHWIFGWAEWWWDRAAIATPKGSCCDRFVTVTWFILFFLSSQSLFIFFFFCLSKWLWLCMI